MKSKLAAILLMTLAGTAFGDAPSPFAIIPEPQQIKALPGVFKLTADAAIAVSGSEVDAEQLAAVLRRSTGFALPVSGTGVGSPKAAITLLIQNGTMEKEEPEGYVLTVKPDGVTITAQTQAGLFYGEQTLLQLLPPEIFSKKVVANGKWEIPCVFIEDWPRFQWRGLMLDVSRHFYDKSEVEQVLDEMALHKLNVFHWHLTDDQGWRIEIPQYPKLTQVGAWRDKSDLGSEKPSAKKKPHANPAWATVAASKFGPDGRYGGFYTEADIREVIAYAAARYITIVPEIEMPGHAVAALAAYPQYSCSGGPFTTNVQQGVNKGVFDPSNDATYEFLDNILGEVFALFPGKYVHVGGDEVDEEVKAATWMKSPQCQALMKREGLKNGDELQSWFTHQIQKYFDAHGKILVGWSEIAQGGLAKGAVVMDWKGGGPKAAEGGNDVVMSPTKYCYFDYYQLKDHSLQPRAIGGYMPLGRVYQFEPIPARLSPEAESHILGGQCNLWTEYVASLAHVQYMLFPRACAMAEALWSPKGARNYADFTRRLKVHMKRLDALGINYCPETENPPASSPTPSK